VKGLNHRLIPIFSDVIAPDPEMAALIDKHRAPFEAELTEVLGETESLLYRRGNFNGTFDDLICQALLQERDADIALSPGFRWGTSLLPGDKITREDLFNATAMSYPAAYRSEMTGEMLHVILEDVADNLFNADPYYQQGGDMVRVGGMGYRIDVSKRDGLAHLRHDASGQRRADRPGQDLHGRRLGVGQRRHRGPADLGRDRGVYPLGRRGDA
jgi:sulfur-oxidizing protein SoxB